MRLWCWSNWVIFTLNKTISQFCFLYCSNSILINLMLMVIGSSSLIILIWGKPAIYCLSRVVFPAWQTTHFETIFLIIKRSLENIWFITIHLFRDFSLNQVRNVEICRQYDIYWCQYSVQTHLTCNRHMWDYTWTTFQWSHYNTLVVLLEYYARIPI